MICLGIDPDLHSTALSVSNGKDLLAVGLIRIPMRHKGEVAVCEMTRELSSMVYHWWFEIRRLNFHAPLEIEKIVCEGQDYVPNRGKARPIDIIRLGQVAGAALCSASILWPNAVLRLPYAVQWKGSVPKGIHQGRILTKLGIPFESKTDWCLPDAGYMVEVPGSAEIPSSAYRHIVDAMGLAVWGATTK